MAVADKHATHLFSYRFDGKSYTVDIIAKDAAEAKERLKALTWARYDGELVARIPAGIGIAAPFLVALRNATRTIYNRFA